MFHGQIIAKIEEGLAAAGVGNGVILRLIPVIAKDAIEVKLGLMTLEQAIADIVSQFGPPTPAAA